MIKIIDAKRTTARGKGRWVILQLPVLEDKFDAFKTWPRPLARLELGAQERERTGIACIFDKRELTQNHMAKCVGQRLAKAGKVNSIG